MLKRDYPLQTLSLPEAPPFKKLLGPSFILLGLGLGSGEIILWPYLVSNFGLGIAWGIVIGITIQFFINMEVERYALIYGESIFVGFARLLRFLPLWFIASTFLGFGWPGIGLSGSHLISQATGLNINVIIIALFLGIGAILSLGKVLYQTVENLQKYLILLGTPLIFVLAIALTTPASWHALALGLFGKGDNFSFIPVGMSLATFLGALAYSGAGGNLNLAQSFYVRDKGYGMGKFAQKITSVFRDPQADQVIRLTGATFEDTPENMQRFRKWWKLMNIEHLVIFWALGLCTMLTLSLLAFSVAHGQPGNITGINFVITEAMNIGARTLPAIGLAFLVIAGLMLAATQLTVLDSTSRIITENLILLQGHESAHVSKIFYIVLWLQIAFGIAVSLLHPNQPIQMLTLGGIVNAFSMFFYIGLILFLSNTVLAPKLRPSLIRNIILVAAMLFFGILCYLVIKA